MGAEDVSVTTTADTQRSKSPHIKFSSSLFVFGRLCRYSTAVPLSSCACIAIAAAGLFPLLLLKQFDLNQFFLNRGSRKVASAKNALFSLLQKRLFSSSIIELIRAVANGLTVTAFFCG